MWGPKQGTQCREYPSKNRYLVKVRSEYLWNLYIPAWFTPFAHFRCIFAMSCPSNAVISNKEEKDQSNPSVTIMSNKKKGLFELREFKRRFQLNDPDMLVALDPGILVNYVVKVNGEPFYIKNGLVIGNKCHVENGKIYLTCDSILIKRIGSQSNTQRCLNF